MQNLLFAFPQWLVDTILVSRTVILILTALLALTIVVTVLMQNNSSSGGTNVMTGVTESYYSQNKGTSREGKLKKITTICSICIVVLIVIYFVTRIIYKG